MSSATVWFPPILIQVKILNACTPFHQLILHIIAAINLIQWQKIYPWYNYSNERYICLLGVVQRNIDLHCPFLVVLSKNLTTSFVTQGYCQIVSQTKYLHHCPISSQFNRVIKCLCPLPLINLKDVIIRIICCFGSQCSHFDAENKSFLFHFNECMEFFNINIEQWYSSFPSDFLFSQSGFPLHLSSEIIAELLTLYLRFSLTNIAKRTLTFYKPPETQYSRTTTSIW